MQYLTFFLRGEEYAAPILRVKEIIEYSAGTRVPATQAHVRGVINLRGAVRPVIDLAVKFGHAESAPTRTTCIIVLETRLEGETTVVGILADAVSEVVDIAGDAIEPPPAFGTGIRIDFLAGMGKLDQRLALILDLDRVLSPVELQQTIDAITEEEVTTCSSK